MKLPTLLLLGTFVALAAGCGPKEPEPAAPVVDQAKIRRELYFGPPAEAPDIAWRSTGLGIRIITPGEGVPPQPTDRIRVHYTGRLKDGKVFDDSRKRGKPADFTVNRLITGWAAAMPALKPGGKAEIFIPPHLGYGGMRAGDVPPNSGLIFEIELLAVNPEPEKKP